MNQKYSVSMMKYAKTGSFQVWRFKSSCHQKLTVLFYFSPHICWEKFNMTARIRFYDLYIV